MIPSTKIYQSCQRHSWLLQAKALSALPMQPMDPTFNVHSMLCCVNIAQHTNDMTQHTKDVLQLHLGHCATHPGNCATYPGYCVTHLGHCVTHLGHCATHLGHCATHPGNCVTPGTLLNIPRILHNTPGTQFWWRWHQLPNINMVKPWILCGGNCFPSESGLDLNADHSVNLTLIGAK